MSAAHAKSQWRKVTTANAQSNCWLVLSTATNSFAGWVMNRVPATCLLAADIAGDVGFYTNAVLGLRTEKKAIDYLDWNRHPDFCQFCGDFLRFQLETMMPRLLVVLGQRPKDTVCSTLGAEIPDAAAWKNRELNSMAAEETIRVVEWRGKRLVVHVTSHPYSDCAKGEAAKAESASRLNRAWATAQA